MFKTGAAHKAWDQDPRREAIRGSGVVCRSEGQQQRKRRVRWTVLGPVDAGRRRRRMKKLSEALSQFRWLLRPSVKKGSLAGS